MYVIVFCHIFLMKVWVLKEMSTKNKSTLRHIDSTRRNLSQPISKDPINDLMHTKTN